MNASSFLANRAPTELIYAIFLQTITSERSQDAVAISLTCRSLRNHWITHRSALLWDLCVEHVPHAQEALLAVCCRRDAELSGGLPPLDISPGDLLSGSASPKSSMTLSEYQHIRALNLLARDRESKLYQYPYTGLPADRPRPNLRERETVLPEDLCSMPEWSDRVHLAIYRTIIVAAGLAGAYQAPTLKATDPEADMSLIFKQVEYAEQHPTNYPKLTAKEVDWLEQFTICNMSSTPGAEEVVFGRVANWLFGNMLEKKSSRDAMAWRFAHDLGRATYCRRLRNSGRVCPVQLVPNSSGTWSHADAHLVVWELMQVFYLFKSLEEDYRMVYRPDNDLSRPRGLAVLAGSYVASERQAPDNLSPPLRHPRPSISVLLPGFTIEVNVQTVMFGIVPATLPRHH
ncbi:hypothetical protein QBC32DRAFT_221267 [Pseudoneurospora amorphoporcata]|uniref:F-box domain-containing protein n=1 Tax=Pseudoneurospora amorphoporcata TaxID=241081 RepID=A0AAN6NPL6_9PEZI|nr:hypothetical protein QBC32DRAFT_221267 [Pseudoneurospora amorphoporcata]